ncbi:hypothetical protein ACXO2X_03695 [Lactobacillus delbrueckii subsp. bulgaricus]
MQDIAGKCFVKAQADRIKDEIKARYGDEPDFPFKKFPDYAVFRNPQNRKWYGLLMAVLLGKLTGNEKDQQEAAVLNLKLAEEKMPALLKEVARWILNCMTTRFLTWKQLGKRSSKLGH